MATVLSWPTTLFGLTARPSSTPKVASSAKGSALEDALKDAEIALKYAAETGKDVSAETAGKIIRLRQALKGGLDGIAANDEAEFWSAAATIARANAPVKVEALAERYAYERHDPQSPIRRSVRNYLLLIWTFLAVTIGTHLVYATIDAATQRADESAKSFDAARDAMRQLHLADGDTSHEDIATLGAVKIQRQIQCSSLRAWTDEIQWMKDLLQLNRGSDLPERKDSYLRANYSCVNNMPVKTYFLDEHSSIGDATEALALFDPGPSDLEFGKSVGLGSAQAWTVRQSAERLRSALIKFVLPLLYGLLGAIAGVVLQESFRPV